MAYTTNQIQQVQRVMVQPINLVFRYLQNRSRVIIWLKDRKNCRISGVIAGFDEYFNVVLEGSEEHFADQEKATRRRPTKLGKILLKGDEIVLIQPENEQL